MVVAWRFFYAWLMRAMKGKFIDESEIGMMPSSFPCVIGNIRLGLVFNLPSCELILYIELNIV